MKVRIARDVGESDESHLKRCEEALAMIMVACGCVSGDLVASPMIVAAIACNELSGPQSTKATLERMRRLEETLEIVSERAEQALCG